MAQVHKAVLKDGHIVAVKIQHKDIQDHSSSDVRTMEVCMFDILSDKVPYYIIILLCPKPDDFTHQGESAATQWINLTICQFIPVNPLCGNA